MQVWLSAISSTVIATCLSSSLSFEYLEHLKPHFSPSDLANRCHAGVFIENHIEPIVIDFESYA